MSRRRIAFLASEFPTETPRGGGLASYLGRIARALRDAGHEPEVFVLSSHAEGLLDHDGVRVQRVRRADSALGVRLARMTLPKLGLARLQPTLHIVAGALGLARALETRHAEKPFDAVQSADYLAVGLCVRGAPARPHIVRCSSASDLWAESDGDARLVRRLEARLERLAIRRADRVYAPSRFVAEHLSRRVGRELAVLRPPAVLDPKPAPKPPRGLPPRYVMHVGKPLRAKGTHLLAGALPRVWAQDPSFTLVVAGLERAALIESHGTAWGRFSDRVVALGSLERPELLAALAQADACVQPSLADNLPNVAIESLLLGVPVVAFAGASLDELVEPGVNGELAPLGDESALGAALLRVWRGESSARKGFRWDGAIAREMRPDCAVRGLLALAGLAP